MVTLTNWAAKKILMHTNEIMHNYERSPQSGGIPGYFLYATVRLVVGRGESWPWSWQDGGRLL